MRHARVIPQRYDMLLGNTQLDGLKHDGHSNIESLMLQISFSFDHEYFILRSMNGTSRIEIKRGAINKNKSHLYISGEDNFLNLSGVFQIRGCTINGVEHVCLVDIPNKLELAPSELRTYTTIALTIPEILLRIRYKDSKFRWHFFSPIIKLHTDNFATKLSSIDGSINFLKSTKQVSDGITIEAGFRIGEFIFSVLMLALVITLTTSILFYTLEIRFKRRLRLNTEKAILQEKLQNLASIQKLIQGVVHDIRSPLAALTFVGQSVADEGARETLELLAKRMHLIINDLEIKHGQLNRSDTSLVPLCGLLKLLIKEKGKEFSRAINFTFIEPGNEYWCRGNFSEIVRVFSNIINNAKQASKANANIWISIDDLPLNRVQITIRDEGKGISSEIANHIFEEGTTFGKENGSGFGLYQAKLVIEKAGGQISFESKQNFGTLFYINLPKQENPSWSVRSIDVTHVDELVIIDDEKHYFEIWKKLSAFSNKPVRYFAHPNAVPNELLPNKNILKIIDNNFGEDTGKGIRFIEECAIQNCILMTSDWLLSAVQNFASRNKVLLLGKEFLSEVHVFCKK